MKPEDPDVHTWLEPELEARIVASLLNETSAFEEAELERLMKERPEMVVFYRRLKAVHGLLGEAANQGPDDEWKLSKERRNKVLGMVQQDVPQDPAAPVKNKRRLGLLCMNLAATAAVLMLVAGLVTLGFMRLGSGSRYKASDMATASDAPVQLGAVPLDSEQPPSAGETYAYAGSAYDKTRATRLDDVVQKWEMPAPPATAPSPSSTPPAGEVVEFEGFMNYKKAEPGEPRQSLAEAESLQRSGEAGEAKETDFGLAANQGEGQPGPGGRGNRERAEGFLTPESGPPGVNVHGRPRLDAWYFEDGRAAGNEGLSLGVGQEAAEESAASVSEIEMADGESSDDALASAFETNLWGEGLGAVPGQSDGEAFLEGGLGREDVRTDQYFYFYNNFASGEAFVKRQQSNGYADFAPGTNRGFGQVSGINLLERNLTSSEEEMPAAAPALELPADGLREENGAVKEELAQLSQQQRNLSDGDDDTVLWASQPGMIRTFDQPAKPQRGEELSLLGDTSRRSIPEQQQQQQAGEQGQGAQQEPAAVAAGPPTITRDFDNGLGNVADDAYDDAPEEEGEEAKPAESTVDSLATINETRVASRQRGQERGGQVKSEAEAKETELSYNANGDQVVDEVGEYGRSLPPKYANAAKAPVAEPLSELAATAEPEAEKALAKKNQPAARADRQNVRAKAPLTEEHASETPFSTFSLHVGDVSFKLAKAALLEDNAWPDAAKVRTDEFVNAFDYGDPAPSLAEKVACHIEQAAHPFRQQRNLLRIALRTADVGRASGVPLQLTLLLDTSGSMERADRQESVDRAMQVLTAQLTPNDTVTLIGFARQPRLIGDRLTSEAIVDLPQIVKQTPSEGGTNLEEALLLAAEHARRQFVDSGQNRIVLLTDGAANLGNAEPESLSEIVAGLRQEGIAFDACGVGAEGLNDSILEALTRRGDGRYYFLNRPEDADDGFARQLAGAFRPAARNVKVQVYFNPRRTGNYRLLGFEKHRLEKEDFRNDKVDAAELASSEAGVALYEIEALPQGEGEIGEVAVRFQDMSTGRMVERTWTIPYQPGAPALDQASSSLQLAGSAAFLAEKLKQTAFGEVVDLDRLTEITANVREHYASNQRVRDLIAMIEKVKGW